MSIPIGGIPERARTAWERLRERLLAILGDDLVALWAYGGTTSAPEGARIGDLDTFVVVRSLIDEATARAIEAEQAAIAAEAGLEWDIWYVTEADARLATPPRHAFRDRFSESWAIDRAHWLAGRYVLLHGAEPTSIVPTPSSGEIAAGLGNELDHLERHIAAGDTDPYEAIYAILNGSRIVRAVETGDVAISKREAGAWAIDHLEARWRPAVHAARRAYEDQGSAADTELLAREVAPFVAMVRERLTGDR
jgi:hypothetical protein